LAKFPVMLSGIFHDKPSSKVRSKSGTRCGSSTPTTLNVGIDAYGEEDSSQLEVQPLYGDSMNTQHTVGDIVF